MPSWKLSVHTFSPLRGNAAKIFQNSKITWIHLHYLEIWLSTLESFKVMQMNQTFDSALLFWKKTWFSNEPYYLIKLLSKNQVIDSIRKLKHLNYLYRKNRKRMSYKWSCIVLNDPDQLYSYSSPPKIGSPLKRSISIH